MKIPAILGSTLVLHFASTSSSQAVAVAILNQSFENPGGGSFSYSPANNWVTSSFTEISTDVGLSGGHLLRHNGQNPGSSASQDLGVGLLTDSIYTLTILIGNRTTDVNNPTGTAIFGLRNSVKNKYPTYASDAVAAICSCALCSRALLEAMVMNHLPSPLRRSKHAS